MRNWIYKANEENYHLAKRLKDPNPLISWVVTRYAELTLPDDLVFLWNSGKERGIVGVMRLISAPLMMYEIPSELVYAVDQNQGLRLRVLGEITHRDVFLTAMKLRNIPELMKCSVFHGFQQATNFSITDKEAQIFLDLIEGRSALP